MPDTIRLPLEALPYVILIGVGLALVAWSFGRHVTGARMAAALVLWAAVSALWLAHNHAATGAVAWYRWVPVTTLLLGVGAVDDFTRRWRIGRGADPLGLAYLVVVVGAVGTILWHPTLVQSGPVGIWWAQGWNRAPLVAAWVGVLVSVTIAGLSWDHSPASSGRLRWMMGAVWLSLSALTEMDVFRGPGMVGMMALPWVGVIGFWILANPQPSAELVLPRVMDSRAGFRYGVWALARRPVGVLAVGAWHLEDTGLTDRLLSQALAQQLTSWCRANDRVMRADTGEFIVILDGVPFDQEPVVRGRIVAALAQSLVSVDGRHLALKDHVHLGWAWADRGTAFARVLDQARQSLATEIRRQAELRSRAHHTSAKPSQFPLSPRVR